MACKSGNFEFVKVLIEAGADVNMVDIKKKMPLNYTEKEKKYQNITDYLIKKGAKNDWR